VITLSKKEPDHASAGARCRPWLFCLMRCTPKKEWAQKRLTETIPRAVSRPYRVDATMKEKEAVIRNDARVASTYLDHYHDDEGGRFAKPQTVIGSDGAQYPMAAPNWSLDPVPPEPPTGHDINEAPIVGEPHEIAKSLAGEAHASAVDPSNASDADAPSPASSPSGVEPPAIQTPKLRRR